MKNAGEFLLESSLNESETRYRTLLELAVDGILLGSHEGIITDANQCMCNIIGLPKEKIVGTHVGTLPFTPESLSKSPLRFDLLQKGEIVINERTFVRPDGSLVDIEMRSKMMPDGTYQSTYRDITDRKQAAQALKNSEEKFRKAFQTSPDSININRLSDGMYVSINRGFTQVMEYTEEDAIGKTSIELNVWQKPEDRQRLVTGLKAHGFVENLEAMFCSKSGRRIAGLMSAAVIELDGVPHIISTTRNITELKQTEEALRNIQKLDSLGVLAGGIAHDFNNLMGGIFSYIDLAMAEIKNEKALLYLSNAMNVMDRVRGLTQQLLTFAKGGAPLQKITPLIPFIQETVQFALSGSNVSCRFEIANDLRPCNIDKNQIAQVIDNIVINAKQAMSGGGNVEILARNISIGEKNHASLGAGDYVQISVKDNGVGIPRESIARIFDPFYTTKATGHGLGLSTCYSIVTRHGGSIQVESESGKGSTFHILLPATIEAHLSIAEAVLTSHSGSGTILVMDDEVVIRETIKRILASLGYTVECRTGGQEAVNFYQSEVMAGRKIAAMIFDLTVIGGMGGKDAVAEIRKLDADIPVFIVSGYADDPIMKNPQAYGFTASLGKPYRKSEVEKMLETHLGNHHN